MSRRATKSYRELFSSHLNIKIINNIREATNGNFVLGDERFKQQIESVLNRRVERGKAGRPRLKAKN